MENDEMKNGFKSQEERDEEEYNTCMEITKEVCRLLDEKTCNRNLPDKIYMCMYALMRVLCGVVYTMELKFNDNKEHSFSRHAEAMFHDMLYGGTRATEIVIEQQRHKGGEKHKSGDDIDEDAVRLFNLFGRVSGNNKRDLN